MTPCRPRSAVLAASLAGVNSEPREAEAEEEEATRAVRESACGGASGSSPKRNAWASYTRRTCNGKRHHPEVI
jgi:hypothetical protein